MSSTDLIASIGDAAGSWLSWRQKQRASLAKRLGVAFGQAAMGASLLFILLTTLGVPFNPVLGYLLLAFAVGSGASGILFAFVWGFIFLQAANLALGLSLGVWVGSPAWWQLAADQWRAGQPVPFLVLGILPVIPLLWVGSCFGLHGVWSELMMILTKLMSRMRGAPTLSEERMKASIKDLEASEAEVARLLNKDPEEDGLVITPKPPFAKDPQEQNATVSRGSLYDDLAADASAPELAGLDESARRSRQTVDASGAIIDATSDAKDAATPASKVATVSHEKSFVKSIPTFPGSGKEQAPASTPAQVKPALRPDEKQRLQNIVENYTMAMMTSSSPQDGLDDFTRKFSSSLTTLNDLEIEYLRQMEGSDASAVAAAALHVQGATTGKYQSFEAEVERSASLDESLGGEIKRPSLLADEEEAGDGDKDAGGEPAAERATLPELDTAPPAIPAAPAEQRPSLFEGDEASRSMSGRRIASLLTLARVEADAAVRTSSFAGHEDGTGTTEEVVSGAAAPVETPGEPAHEEPVAVLPVSRKSASAVAASDGAADSSMSERLRAIQARIEADQNGDATSTEEAPEAASDKAPVAGEEAAKSGTPAEPEAAELLKGFVLDIEKPCDPAAGNAAGEVAGDDVLYTVSQGAADAAEAEAELPEEVRNEEKVATMMASDVSVDENVYTTIFGIMRNPQYDDETRFHRLHQLADSVGAQVVDLVRSDGMIKALHESTAADTRQMVLTLLNDFRDKKGEKAVGMFAQIEALITEIQERPFLIDRSKIYTLRARQSEVRELVFSMRNSDEKQALRLKLTGFDVEIQRLEGLLNQPQADARSPISIEEMHLARHNLMEAMGNHEVEVVEEKPARGKSVRAKMVAGALSSISATIPGFDDEDEDPLKDDIVPSYDADVENDDQAEAGAKTFSWEDPSIGDLDASDPALPVGDSSSPEHLAAMSQHFDLLRRRANARLERDAYLAEKEKEEAERRRESDGANADRQRRIEEDQAASADLAREREELVSLRATVAQESRLLEAARAEQARAEEYHRERQRIVDERENAMSARALTLDGRESSLSEREVHLKESEEALAALKRVFGDFDDRKIAALSHVSHNFPGFFSSRRVPPRFEDKSEAFLSLVSAREIQKRSKAWGIRLHEMLKLEEGLPERLSPFALTVSSLGSLVYIHARDVLIEIRTRLEVADESLDSLLDATDDEADKAFIREIHHWMVTGKQEFDALGVWIKENAADWDLARKSETVGAMDFQALAQEKQTLHDKLTESEAARAKLEGDLVSAQQALEDANRALDANTPPKPETYKGASGETYDQPELIEQVLAVFREKGFLKTPLNFGFEVGTVRVCVGVPERGDGKLTIPALAEEMSARQSSPHIILTNVGDVSEEISGRRGGTSTYASFRPLTVEAALNVIKDEEFKASQRNS